MNDQDIADAERHQQELEQMEQDYISADEYYKLTTKLNAQILGAIKNLKQAKQTNFQMMQDLAIAKLIKLGEQVEETDQRYVRGIWK